MQKSIFLMAVIPEAPTICCVRSGCSAIDSFILRHPGSIVNAKRARFDTYKRN